jgi:hypothetical protein
LKSIEVHWLNLIATKIGQEDTKEKIQGAKKLAPKWWKNIRSSF